MTTKLILVNFAGRNQQTRLSTLVKTLKSVCSIGLCYRVSFYMSLV